MSLVVDVGAAEEAPARSRRARGLPQLVFAGLLAAVLLAPLPLGAVEMWAWAALALAAGILLLVHAVGILRGEPHVGIGRLAGPLALYGLAVGWAVLQTLPAPLGGLRHPLWDAAAHALGIDLPGAVSIAPDEGGHAVARLLAYAGIVLLAVDLCRDRVRALWAVRAAAAAVAACGFYGIAVFLGGNRTILWLEKTAYSGDLTAVFVNRNSFATFAGLGLLCAVALLVRGLRRAVRSGRDRAERRRALAAFAAGEGWLLAGMAFVTFVALLLSHSRAGLLGTLLGLLAFLLASAASYLLSFRRAAALGACGCIGLLLLVILSGEITFARMFQTDAEAAPRLVIYASTLDAIADAPWLGTGLGSFKDVIRMYRPADLGETFFQAHNSYLENALELGVPAAAAFYAALAWLAGLCLAGVVRRRRDAIFPCLGLAATVLVGVHSLVDFSLQIPAVAALYALLLGTGVAQSWSSRHDTRR